MGEEENQFFQTGERREGRRSRTVKKGAERRGLMLRCGPTKERMEGIKSEQGEKILGNVSDT